VEDHSGNGASSHGHLTGCLVTLAGTPDDDSSIPVQLRSITQLAADLLPTVAYTSITGVHEGAYTTVAMSTTAALAVDEAQYADRTGPCLEALDGGSPQYVPRIDTTMKWPGFRQAAHRLGLHTSLSIPVFAGRGTPIAALNLYGRDPESMAPMGAAVLAVYDGAADSDLGASADDLGAGVGALIRGLAGAFGVRARIQQALGMIMQSEGTGADAAYTTLRLRAVAGNCTLTAAAATVLADASRGKPLG
jgi:hypothetical protein